jgi:hypothetical protein
MRSSPLGAPVAEMPERRTRSRAASPALAVSSNARSPTYQRHRLFHSRLDAFSWENHPFCILHHVWSVLSRLIDLFDLFDLHSFTFSCQNFFFFFSFFLFIFASFEPGYRAWTLSTSQA